MVTEHVPSSYEDGEIFGTVTVTMSKNVQFGYRVQVYTSLLEISGSDVISSFYGDRFTIPNVPKSTYRVMVDMLSEHPAEPAFRFRPRRSAA